MDKDEMERLREYAAQGFRRIPVWKKVAAGARKASDVFLALKNLSSQCFILESAEDPQKWGRYTFIGYDPKMEITCFNGAVSIKNGVNLCFETANPNEYIGKIIEENKSPRLDALPPFAGGLVGYFSYDYIKYSEPTLQLDASDEEGFKDADFLLFDKIVVFDNLEQSIIVIINIAAEALEENYRRAQGELEHLAAIVMSGEPATPKPLRFTSGFRELFPRVSYCAMVEKAKRHIREGDIFQVVLSNRFDADVEGSLFHAYSALRRLNPSPYMFYFSSDDIEIAGASPETLVKLDGRTVHTFPLAGTRPRGETPESDAALEQELLADPKELAEHTMLVDLGRNDLGRVCDFGSVVVEKYLSIERFSHVMHIGSTIRGTICRDKTALDAIDAALPAGTLSGAPKLRACEIINQLENNKRGLYGGAVGYIAFTGTMDVCIAIRLAFKKNGKVFVRSGAGIVADSIPDKEYEECNNKMKAALAALEEASL